MHIPYQKLIAAWQRPRWAPALEDPTEFDGRPATSSPVGRDSSSPRKHKPARCFQHLQPVPCWQRRGLDRKLRDSLCMSLCNSFNCSCEQQLCIPGLLLEAWLTDAPGLPRVWALRMNPCCVGVLASRVVTAKRLEVHSRCTSHYCLMPVEGPEAKITLVLMLSISVDHR